jgi:phage/plasmid-associated DNA primase
MSSKHEHNIFDLGEEGDNGKGVLAFALSQVFDGYYEDLPLSIVSQDPPSGGKVSPEVWMLKGSHFLGTPESEKSIVIKSLWLKQLADQSTVWKARGLYKDTQSFRIPALWAMSSNLRIKLTSIDGGVRRRLRGVTWPVAFKAIPEGPFQRPRSVDNLKEPSFYSTDLKAGIIHVTLAAHEAFFKGRSVGLEVVPCVINRSTQILLVQEYSEYVEDFLANHTTDEAVPKESSTKAKIMQAFRTYVQAVLGHGQAVDQNALSSAMDSVTVTKIPHGTVERLNRISSKKYIKLVSS